MNWWHKKVNPFYTLGEEILNSVTHGIGALLALVALVVLVYAARNSGDGWLLLSVIIYGICLTLLYLASTLYHAVQHPRFKRYFRVADHAAIYLLIAGTYTPFLLYSLRGAWGWTYMVIIWLLAVIGVIFKIFFVHRFDVISTIAYVAMGWLSVFAMGELMKVLPFSGLVWLLVGGLTYTVGVIFFALKRIPYNHAIWHLFVLGGSVCHFFAVLSLVPRA